MEITQGKIVDKIQIMQINEISAIANFNYEPEIGSIIFISSPFVKSLGLDKIPCKILESRQTSNTIHKVKILFIGIKEEQCIRIRQIKSVKA